MANIYAVTFSKSDELDIEIGSFDVDDMLVVKFHQLDTTVSMAMWKQDALRFVMQLRNVVMEHMES